MQSDVTSWSVAILLSLLVHSLILMQSGARMGAESATVLRAPHVTRLSFNQLAEKPLPDKPAPTSHVKKSTAEPDMAQQKVRRVEPIEKTVEHRKLVSLPQVRGQQVSQSTDGLLKQKSQQYLHRLLSHIESNKFYPRAARKRSIEGEVKISFVLRDDGYYEQLTLDGEKTVLVEAARQALEYARPLPVPPEGIVLSRQIEFTMIYSIIR